MRFFHKWKNFGNFRSNTFNSLYEIRKVINCNPNRITRNFQFSLWDSFRWFNVGASSVSLSILFMRFNNITAKKIEEAKQLSILFMRFLWKLLEHYSNTRRLSILFMRFLQIYSTFRTINCLSILFMRFLSNSFCLIQLTLILSILFMRFSDQCQIRLMPTVRKLSILFMRFLYENIQKYVSKANFQFSLWDSMKKNGKRYKKQSFNSLYEIPFIIWSDFVR
mgnify:CR=1 FL=1